MITNEQVISIGRLTRTHGKRGELQCLMSNDYWDNADATFIILKLDNILVPFRVLDWRGKGSDSLILQLDHINDETVNSYYLSLYGNFTCDHLENSTFTLETEAGAVTT